jgi:hypothetical protein
MKSYLLLIPQLFKDNSHPLAVGPDLSDLEFSEISFENTQEDFHWNILE